MKFAGIGSRTTPKNILIQMRKLASVAAKKGHILRSGGASGADTSFELGCNDSNGNKEIFLPWKNFNRNTSLLYTPTENAKLIASEIHLGWKFMKLPAKLLIARNMHQILGINLNDPVSCVICWTEDGCESIEQYSIKTGGTGSAIALASIQNIPIYNLCNSDRYVAALEFLSMN